MLYMKSETTGHIDVSIAGKKKKNNDRFNGIQIGLINKILIKGRVLIMGFIKCPRCELNYIPEEEKHCNVCKKELLGEADADEIEDLCVECGERIAIKSSDLCIICLRERKRTEAFEKTNDEKSEDEEEDEDKPDVEDAEELDLDIQEEDIPPNELDEIDKELAEEDIEDDDITGVEVNIDELIQKEDEEEDENEDY